MAAVFACARTTVLLALAACLVAAALVSPAVADSWTGTALFEDGWSDGENWLDGSPPGATDTVLFNNVDTGKPNIVDRDFTIAGLSYLGNGTHTTSVSNGSTLSVQGPVAIGYGGSADGGTAIWNGLGGILIGETTAPQPLTIGYNGSDGPSNATGVLDALQGNVTMNLTELNVGYSYSGYSATGTLRWNRPEPIYATDVYFGRGGAIGVLEVPAGGTFLLGSAQRPVANLHIGLNDGNGGGATHLDFTTTNPTFAAYLGGLDLGYKGGGYGPGNGQLTLGSNSTLVVGTEAAPAYVYVGFNGSDGPSIATGVLDALQGNVTMNLTELNVGYSYYGYSATGTFKMGPGATVSAQNIYVGRGSNATGTLMLDRGSLTATAISVGSGGTLAGNGTITGDVNLTGGRVQPGLSVGRLTVIGNFDQEAGSTASFEIAGVGAGQYDVLDMSGSATVGGTLNLDLLVDDYTPAINDSFDIITAASHTGTFSKTSNWYIGNRMYFKPDYSQADRIRVVVKEVPPEGALPHAGDANDDNNVNVDDLGILATNYDGSASWARGDFSGDWIVNVDDLGVLATNYDWVGPGGASVPEPTALLLLACAATGLLRHRRAAQS